MTEEPLFLALEQVLRIQHHQIETYGGLHGVRDLGGLQTAITMPAASFGGEYLHDSIYAMAAAYLFHITKNHPFLDGNERAGAAVAAVFLIANGYEMTATEQEFGDITLGVAEGTFGKAELDLFFRRTVKKRPSEA